MLVLINTSIGRLIGVIRSIGFAIVVTIIGRFSVIIMRLIVDVLTPHV